MEQGDDKMEREVRLQFPVGHVHHLLKKGNYAQAAQCVSAGAPGEFYVTSRAFSCLSSFLSVSYLSAILKYLATEILDLAGSAARDNKKQCIVPHLY